MAELPDDLIFRRRWWWDPIDMEVLKHLKQNVLQEVVAISLDTQAQVMKTQAAGMEKMSAAIKSGAKQ